MKRPASNAGAYDRRRTKSSALKARARANGNGVEVGGQGEGSKPWGAGIVIRRHYFRLSPVCGSIAWAGLSQLPCLPLTQKIILSVKTICGSGRKIQSMGSWDSDPYVLLSTIPGLWLNRLGGSLATAMPPPNPSKIFSNGICDR